MFVVPEPDCVTRAACDGANKASTMNFADISPAEDMAILDRKNRLVYARSSRCGAAGAAVYTRKLADLSVLHLLDLVSSSASSFRDNIPNSRNDSRSSPLQTFSELSNLALQRATANK